MDKQQYIVVTNETSYKQGLIYPVRDYAEDRRFWRVVGTNQVIAKEDCESYAFPTLQPVQEGHTITTHQLQCLKQMVLDEHEHLVVAQLAEWFPTVFKAERTYQPGTRFIVGDDELMLTKTGELWRMVDLNTGKGANRSIRHDLNKEALKDDDMNTLLDGAAFTLME